MKGLKCLHVCHGRPLHPVLRDLGMKSYEWTSALQSERSSHRTGNDAAKDWKGVDILFLNFRSLGNLEKLLDQLRGILSHIPEDKRPQIIPLAEDFTAKELEFFKNSGFYDFIDLEPISTLAERTECQLHRYEITLRQQKNYRRTRTRHESLKNNNKDLKRMTLTDDLTGLNNTRYMKEVFPGLFSLVGRYNRPLSVVMLDLDYFKDVNDKNDHLVGSTVLKEIGRIIKEHTRQSDIRIRYGGDEFVVIMPETTADSAKIVADRIRQKIEELTMTVTADCIVKITASLGVASFDKSHHSEYWELLREADMAMYQAKESGRNRSCFYDGKIKGYDALKSSFATVLKQILDIDNGVPKKMPAKLGRYLHNIKKGEHGFGLLEMLVTIAIMGVVMVGFMQTTSNNFKAQKGVQDYSDLNSFGTALRLVMSQTVGCTANLVSGSQPVQFDSSQIGVLQTTIAGKPIISEIDYPIQTSPGVYAPNPLSPLIATSGTYQTYQNWQVTQIGLRVLGMEGPATYNVSIEVDFKKINTQSFGGSAGLSQATAITVMTSGTSGVVTVQQCGGDETILPSGAIMPFNLSVCPTGWTVFTPAQGTYIVGLNPGGTLGATGGVPLADKETRMVPIHSHPFSGTNIISFGGVDLGAAPGLGGYGLTVSNPTVLVSGDYPATSLAAPYVQLLYCQKN